MKRRIYLKMQELGVAQDLLCRRYDPGDLVGEEEIPSRNAAARVTSRPVFARISSPGFHSAAMDGFAVVAQSTFSARDDSPVSLKIGQEAVPVNTGFPLPEGMNAVVMIEHCLIDKDEKYVLLRSPVFPWQNVRKVGEDIVATELVFPSNHLIAPYDVGALLASGNPTVRVWKRPIVRIIPTGSELISIDDGLPEKLEPGKIPESNSAVLAALCQASGAEAMVDPIVADEPEAIEGAVREAISSDAHVVLINAGSSAGSADYTVSIIEKLGEVLVHGITIMPGKPTIVGIVSGKPVIGIPGYPVSAIIAFEQIVAPLLHKLQGKERPLPVTVRARLTKSLPSRAGIEEFRRVVAGKVGESVVASPIKKGAGSISTITKANAILRIPLASEGLEEGAEVELELIRPWQSLEKTLICTGSHDLSLDIIADFLKRKSPAMEMASTHVGSLGGIHAVAKRLCHVAGTHLLNPDDGSYNVSYVKKYIDKPALLINLVYRQQGLMVRKGNPLSINSIADLTREDVTFVNRQLGSGTRVLLDYELSKLGISPEQIRGYDNEEYTHMAVAVSILSGKADAGLGILSAAKALGLDFIPVVEERYDLLVLKELLEQPPVRMLLECIEEEQFKETVEGLGGYDTRDTGKVMYEHE
ncbi:MAG: molybdopterin biosynthesis protein [Thermodesulfobacteria bacterium]|nr:molybdopterin biosynthesis protein [Thermodesulfobacteriota bacterium]